MLTSEIGGPLSKKRGRETSFCGALTSEGGIRADWGVHLITLRALGALKGKNEPVRVYRTARGAIARQSWDQARAQLGSNAKARGRPALE